MGGLPGSPPNDFYMRTLFYCYGYQVVDPGLARSLTRHGKFVDSWSGRIESDHAICACLNRGKVKIVGKSIAGGKGDGGSTRFDSSLIKDVTQTNAGVFRGAIFGMLQGEGDHCHGVQVSISQL